MVRLLAYLAQPDHITTIRAPQNGEVTEIMDILQAFVHLYKDLYLSCASPNQAALSPYSAEIDLPVLSEDDRELLEKDITLEEVELAIASFAPLKSQCLVGVHSEWYGTFRVMLTSHLIWVLKSERKEGSLPPSMREALVVLISKRGKDTKECDSYRPISLMNVDKKILAKIFG